MPKHEKSVRARVSSGDLKPGEIKLLSGDLFQGACPTCGTKQIPEKTLFLTNIGGTTGDPFLCIACGYQGHIVDGSWRKL